MKKTVYHIFLLALAGSCFWTCRNDEKLYDDVSSRIWLSSEMIVSGNTNLIYDSLRYSFALQDPQATEGTTYFVAHLTGLPADTDREFRLEAVAEGTNVSPGDYTLGETVIPAGAFEATIPVHLKRTVAGLDLTDAANDVTARLQLRLVPNDNFLNGPSVTPYPTIEDAQVFTLIWCDFLVKPASWSYFIDITVGTFSQARYRFYIEFSGKTELDGYNDNSVEGEALASALRRALQEYNDLADLEGRPHYMDDDGSDLTF